jgi:DNA-binding MarR family transcriptional regulator
MSDLSSSPGRVAWHQLLQVSSRVLRELDRRLDEQHRLRVTEFDVLITLDNAEERRLRMTELARATLLSSGGLTRLVGRLEDRGLVRRERDELDGRGFHAGLTGAGLARLAEARLTHDAVLAAQLDAHASATQLESLSRVLSRVLEGGAETST